MVQIAPYFFAAAVILTVLNVVLGILLSKRILKISSEARSNDSVLIAAADTSTVTAAAAADGSFIAAVADASSVTRLSMQYVIAKLLMAGTNLEEVINSLLPTIATHMNWAAGAFWKVDADKSCLRCSNTCGSGDVAMTEFLKQFKLVQYKKGAGLPGQVWELGRPLWIRDIADKSDVAKVTDETDETQCPLKELAIAAKLKSTFCFPITCAGETLGVFEFFTDTSSEIDPQLTQTLSAIGLQIGQFMVRLDAEQALKSSEKLLQLSQARTDLAVKGSQDGIFDWDLIEHTYYYSDRCYEQLGYEKGHLDLTEADSLYRLVHPEDEGRLKLALTEHFENQIVFDIDYRLRTKGGDYTWVQSRGQADWNAAGIPVRFAGFHHDINDRMLAQEELRKSESRFSQMANNINEVFWTSDARGTRPTYVSPAYEAIYGRTLQELFEHPKTFFDATHPDDRRNLAAIIRLQARVHYSCQIEYRIIRPDGKIRWLWARLCPLMEDGELTGLCGVTSDITDKKAAEKRVSEFYSTISHELRTPLTSIRGSLGLIEGGIAGDITPKVAKLIKIGRVETDRLIRLVNDILDIKKIEAGQFQIVTVSINPALIATQALEGIAGMALENNMRLECIIESNDKVWGNADLLIQVLTNLLSNAIKYSFPNTVITLGVFAGEPGMVRFEIRDLGPGIKPEDLNKLFVMFQQLDQSDSRSKGGTGLGLAISKGIITEHGGKIGVESEIGKGSTFWFEIPADIKK